MPPSIMPNMQPNMHKINTTQQKQIQIEMFYLWRTLVGFTYKVLQIMPLFTTFQKECENGLIQGRHLAQHQIAISG